MAQDKEYDFQTRRMLEKDMLMTGRRITTKELSEKFNVSKQTILKDIGKLPPDFQLTVYRGPKGGYEYTGLPKLNLSLKAYRELRAGKSEFSADVSGELEMLDKLTENTTEQ